MDNFSTGSNFMACRARTRQAMSLLELSVVVAILGLLTIAAVTRFGHDALGNGGAEGLARKLALALNQARRCTIASGDNHYVQLNSSGGSIVSFALIRKASGGDIQVDQAWTVPQNVTVSSASSQLEFDFEGSALGSYSVTVAGPDRSWNISVVMLTGTVQVSELP